MRAERKELTDRIRQDLSDQVKAKSNGQSGVVLAEEVQQALHRHLVFNQVCFTHFPSLQLHVLLDLPCFYTCNTSVAPSLMLPSYHQYLPLFIQMIFPNCNRLYGVTLFFFICRSDTKVQEGTVEGSIQRAH
jgi:hypothetical protein